MRFIGKLVRGTVHGILRDFVVEYGSTHGDREWTWITPTLHPMFDWRCRSFGQGGHVTNCACPFLKKTV